ncbi:response regulator [Magnetospirillum sp. 15-1]|uniref:DNA-binding response regulator n=1 Tax=Magnetospirillum sp. 15-1 TaxID=1979370 RepID=UPI000BBC6F1A|nr:response regulator [Magnetospirillum sp. 15-1]
MPTKPRILFVDDEVRVLQGLRRGMHKHEERWEMEFVSDPTAALDAMRAQPFDVVVSDMKMPGMTGIDMVVAMREVAPDAAYIMLTGTADLRTAIDAINRADMFRFFTKPCPAFLLAEGIVEALAARRPPEQPPSMGEAALDRLPVGVVVVDATGHALFMNRRGAALCAAEDGLLLAGGRQVRAASAAESAALHRAVTEILTGGGTAALSITRPSLKRSLSVLISPLPGSRAALYIGDPDDLPLVPPEQLARLLDLTPSEARLTHSLALGHSVEEAAGLSEVTVSTARSYLKQVFVKTGTARQAELVKLVLGLPAVED